MIVTDDYWIHIGPPHQADDGKRIAGKWLCFGPTEKLHRSVERLNLLVEKRVLLAAKIARKDPEKDPFPNKPCVICAYTSSEQAEIEQAAKILRDIGLNPSEWKSEAEATKEKKRLAARLRAFISCPWHDKLVAHKIVEVFERADISCWYAERDLPAQEVYNPLRGSETIGKAIQESEIFVLVCSIRAGRSTQIQREVEAAHAHWKPLLALRLDSATPKALEGILRTAQSVDASKIPIDQAIQLLLQKAVECGGPVSDQTPDNAIAPPTPPTPQPPAGERSVPSYPRQGDGTKVKPYKGSGAYMFVSYAHEDRAVVFPELVRFHGGGFRVWYDEGIAPSTVWSEEIARALDQSSYFLVFITPRAVKSQFVQMEINFAFRRQKPFLAVYLEETALPLGLEIQMGIVQALMKYRISGEDYWDKLQEALPENLREESAKSSTPERRGWCDEILPAGMTRGGQAPILTWDTGKGLHIEMVYVPPGDFAMGSNDSDGPESPEHVHAMPTGHWIGRYPVTWRQYLAFCASTGRRVPDDPPWARAKRLLDHPVVNVTWQDAVEFAAWAECRLPSEAEWEKAARGTDGRSYPWGHDAPTPDHVISDSHPLYGNSSTAPAGSAPRGCSPFGAVDMLGNVWEWCADAYQEQAYARYAGGDLSVSEVGTVRVDRGGSWDGPVLPVWKRGAVAADKRSPCLGFRVAK